MYLRVTLWLKLDALVHNETFDFSLLRCYNVGVKVLETRKAGEPV